MSEMVDRFISSAILTGTTLTITTGSKVVENYYSSIENDEYMIGSYCYDRYVYEDEYGLTVGDTTSDNYEEKAAEKGAVYITLLTEKQVPAYQFYRKNGFQEREENVFFVKQIGK